MNTKDVVLVQALRWLPKKSLSRGVRRLVGLPSQAAIRAFVARYGALPEEAEKPLAEYRTLLEFFTRRLKSGVRPIEADPNALICPVDGAFLVGGPTASGKLYQAKGREFTLEALLASEDAQSVFGKGAYAILYLAPGDYHRIHSPVSGVITGYTYVPGSLFPVNEAAMEHVDALLARNERLITHIESPTFGRVDVVKVGATCVGRIRACYDAEVKTNARGGVLQRQQYAEGKRVERGDEIGVFEMGSTVVVVVERPVDILDLGMRAKVRMGRALGWLNADAAREQSA